MIPVVSFPDRWWCEGANDRWVAVAMKNGWSIERVRRLMAVHEPRSRPAVVPHSRRLVIGARADGICTPAHAEALWEHWGRPRLHWYPGGHLVQLGRGAALGQILRLLADEGLLRAHASAPARSRPPLGVRVAPVLATAPAIAPRRAVGGR
jgi:hypothetical protein